MKYHMRRKDKEITDPSEMKKLLEQVEYVTLAMAKDNIPYLVTLSHGYDPEKNEVYFHSASTGKKLDIMRENPRVWGQAMVDMGYAEGECNHHYASVMFSGAVSFIEDENEKYEILTGMARKFKEEPEAVIGAQNASVMNTVVGKISVDYMTGKKSKDFL